MENKTQLHLGWAQRAGHELKEYAAISLYLYFCFGVVLLYKASVLRGYGIDYSPYGFAAIKALILAKFMLIGHTAKIGQRYGQKPLIYPILYKSLVFLVLLVVLSVIEETIAGVLHGRSFGPSLSKIERGTWFQIAATCVLLWVILLPYFGFRQIGERLGEATLHRMLFIEPA